MGLDCLPHEERLGESISLEKGCFWKHLTAPPLPTSGNEGDGARILTVANDKRATMSTSRNKRGETFP